jgi:hypothetical protein
MNIQKKLIEPLYAKELLARNNKNRKLSNKLVNKLAYQIEQNKWYEDTGESIKVDKYGNLLDGQHRLNAIVKANKAVKTILITDMEPEAMNYIDTGKSRSAKDLLVLNNVKYANLIVSLVSVYYDPTMMRTKTMSNKDILDCYYRNKNEFDYCAKKGSKYYDQSNQMISKSDITIMLYLFRKKDLELADNFVKMVSTGISINSNLSPEHNLRQWLLSQKNDKNPVTNRVRRWTWIKFFNKYIAGETVQNFHVQRSKILVD